MKDLEIINKKIKKLENSRRVKKWCEKNPEKAKKIRDNWNRKNRNEYQRKYRALQKSKRKMK